MPRLTTVAPALLLWAIVAACASPASRFYTLSGAASSPAMAPGPSVVVGPVSLPALVDRPQIVVHSGENEVRLDEFNRWASPLHDNIASVIASNLAHQLASARVWPYAQAPLSNADYRVLIDVQRFESTLGQEVLVDILWTVRPASGGTPKTGRSLVREPTAEAGFDPLVAAHSRALARVSADIAAAIRAP